MSFNPRYAFFILIFVLLAIYAMYQARFLILGPSVTITSHEDGAVVSGPLITLEGLAKNISWISLNGRQIFTNEKGFWSEKLIVATGTSIMTVRVKDRLGRESEDEIRIILK
ncbi:hypothetical protein GW944_01005 [Candidatus Parcubacteria bacterium]|nr:hypothetical protein [Candidatus Parcubacteria bacterium]